MQNILNNKTFNLIFRDDLMEIEQVNKTVGFLIYTGLATNMLFCLLTLKEVFTAV